LIRRSKGWTLKEIGLLVTVIVTTLGGIGTVWSLHASYTSEQKAQHDSDIQRAQNFTQFRDHVNDTLDFYKYRLNRLEAEMDGCHK
jgi:uncharacterized protein (UPF0333 family)